MHPDVHEIERIRNVMNELDHRVYYFFELYHAQPLPVLSLAYYDEPHNLYLFVIFWLTYEKILLILSRLYHYLNFVRTNELWI
eukprot:UN18300